MFNFKLLKTYINKRSRKTQENLKNLKKKVSVFGEKKTPPKPIPKSDLGFGCRLIKRIGNREIK